LPRAASLASSILKKYGTSVSALKLIPSSGGVFEIYYDKNLIFSKKDEGRFPEESEVLNTLDNFD
jgi:selT/selW/selH selenoprotein domain